jgi:hypothetical protein
LWYKITCHGTIEGYSHENESRWGLEDEGQTLVFYNQEGSPSTKFNLLKTTVKEKFSSDSRLACLPGLVFKRPLGFSKLPF